MANLPGGKSQARKIYGYIRVPKQEVTIVINNVTRSFDAQSMAYHRDFFHVINSALQSTTDFPVGVIGEYDEDLIPFNWESSNSSSFNITFTGLPVVVLDVIPNEELENVNVFLISNTNANLTVGVSAPFSGSIRYRAIYSNNYPVTVQRTVLSSSFSYTATAGYIDLAGVNFFTASYTSLGSPPTSVFFTPYDINSNNDANVALVNSGSYGLTSTNADISSAIVNRINFLAVI